MASDRRRVAGGSGDEYELVKEAIHYVSFLVYISLSVYFTSYLIYGLTNPRFNLIDGYIYHISNQIGRAHV